MDKHVGEIMPTSCYRMTNLISVAFLRLQLKRCCGFVCPPICSWTPRTRADQPLLRWEPRLRHHRSVYSTGGPGVPVPVCHWLQRRWTELLRCRVQHSLISVISLTFQSPLRCPSPSPSPHGHRVKDSWRRCICVPSSSSSPRALPQLILQLIRTCSVLTWCRACH